MTKKKITEDALLNANVCGCGVAKDVFDHSQEQVMKMMHGDQCGIFNLMSLFVQVRMIANVLCRQQVVAGMPATIAEGATQKLVSDLEDQAEALFKNCPDELVQRISMIIAMNDMEPEEGIKPH